MTPELDLLLWSVILTFVLILIPAGEALRRNGAEAQGGARDNLPEPSIFNRRATRLYKNMLENMVLFTPLVLITHLAEASNSMTLLGAQIFFYSRVAHAVIYLAGWPMIRPLAWFASVIGMGMIAWQLL
ncbi:MAG: MAPEG family protein [Kordiimonadaceae bacterium]|nr:MAPEG family protein [Kordiimonadaceae bacterium]MBO6569171.1 MAPEG family protein [Kordiimonadaceae bacterium]MBO6964647.1 MAPEG family protein [Kordiimonadaceae bacterium]